MFVGCKNSLEFGVNYNLFKGLLKFDRDAKLLCKQFQQEQPGSKKKKRKNK